MTKARSTKARSTKARSIAAHIAVVDAMAAGPREPAAALGAALSRLPDGYDSTDLRMLEWIAAHRRHSRANISDLAA